jgi:hypothetical protein
MLIFGDVSIKQVVVRKNRFVNRVGRRERIYRPITASKSARFRKAVNKAVSRMPVAVLR